MGKKAAVVLSAATVFIVVAFVTWKMLETRQPPMILPALAFPSYPGATSTGEPAAANGGAGQANGGVNAPQAKSLTEACTIFNGMVRETAARANFCRTDADCTVQVHDVCALGCEYLYNKDVDIGSVLTAATVYQQQRCPECPKICLQHAMQNVVCRNSVCVVK